MNIREQLAREHSKKKTMEIVAYIGESQRRFDQLVSIFLHDEYRIVQRAAGIVGICINTHPKLAKKHMRLLVNCLGMESAPVAVKRNVVRLLQFTEIPHSLEGKVMSHCFRMLASPAEPVAVKVFSLMVLARLAVKFPDIVPEIKFLIKEQEPHASPALRSRVRRVLTVLDQA